MDSIRVLVPSSGSFVDEALFSGPRSRSRSFFRLAAALLLFEVGC